MLNINNLNPLPEFSWTNSTHRVVDEEYFDFYHINFSKKFSEKLTHHFGIKPLGSYTIAIHYFALLESIGTVVINHGYMDHSGLYSHIIEVLLAAGYNVLIYDLPGHGLSSGEQAGIPDFADYQTVFTDLLAYAEPHLTQPLMLIGQSTGGAIAMDYVMNNPKHHFTKMILLAPLVIPKRWRYVKFQLSLIGNTVTKVPRDFLKNSSDTEFLNFIKNVDPLQSRFVKVSWGKALNGWQSHFTNSVPSKIPALLIQGEKDCTVDWEYNVPKIIEKFSKMRVVKFKDANHQLVNEAENLRKNIFAEMLDFLCITGQH